VQADATATTLFTVGPHPLVLAHANATTGFTAAPLPLVLAQSPVGKGIMMIAFIITLGEIM